MPPRLIPYPLLQKRPIHQLPAIRDLSLDHRLASVKAQQRRDARDHKRRAQPSRPGIAHDIRGVVLDGAEPHAALGLADAGFYERLDQRLRGAAGAAPGCRPEGEKGRA